MYFNATLPLNTLSNKKLIMRYFILIALLSGFLACKKEKEDLSKIEPTIITCWFDTTNFRLPICIKSAVDSAMSRPKGSFFYSIDMYKYNGDTVYFYVSGCCDRYNPVKDKYCNTLFSPSGGFSGAGDGAHTNSSTQAQLIRNLWRDNRP
jgi:hypothetical protein